MPTEGESVHPKGEALVGGGNADAARLSGQNGVGGVQPTHRHSWVSYCEDIVISERVVKIYQNSKPWVSRICTVLLNKHSSKLAYLSYVLQKDI